MKNKILTLITVLATAVLFYFSVSAFKNITEKPVRENAVETASSVRDTFTNCIFNASFDEINKWGLGTELHVGRNLARYSELNFNAVHSYDESGSVVYGYPNSPMNPAQIQNYQFFLDSVKDNSNLYGFFERSAISKYCYGQRLIYEVAPENGNTTLNYGFVYRTRDRGSYDLDEGRTVVHAVPQTSAPAGYLCKDIYENLQHSDLFDFRQNDKGTWYIKPVMKIPQNTPPLTRVVRIDVVAFNGDIVRQIDIKAGNFNEMGNYIDTYNDLIPNLTISGDVNSTDLNYGRGSDENWSQWDNNCHVDFRVWWYGECEVWFDRMIVDDETANDLFDINKQNRINDRISQEAANFTNIGAMSSFFVDEVCISQYPCIKYVFDKLRGYNPQARVSIAVTNYLNIHGLKNPNPDLSVFTDTLKPDFLQDDHHGFYLDQNGGMQIPQSLSGHDNNIPSSWFTGAQEYNTKLQNAIGGKNDAAGLNETGSLVYEIVKTRSAAKGNIKFIMQPQIHEYMFADTNISTPPLYKNGLREPTNEEIQLQAMVSLSHGADGLCWFLYNSFVWKTQITQKLTLFMAGLLDTENPVSKRNSNCYGQNKWQYVSDMNGKIKNWTPALENTNWLEGFTVHQNTANHRFIEDIKSIYRDNTGTFIDGPSCPNCDNIKYWEEGFFEPKNESADKSLYVLLTNRRCYPEVTQGAGDLRMLKIKFKPNELIGFNNWILKDVNTGQSITFNKNNQGTDGYLFLGNSPGTIGVFQPGEGKLFKLAPVMQEGGTFVCDEEVSGQTFNCYGTVGNGGYSLDLYNSTVSCNDGVQMTFTTGGDLSIYGNTTLKGLNGNRWHGIYAENLDEVAFENSEIKDINSGWAIQMHDCYSFAMLGCVINSNPSGLTGALIINNTNSNFSTAVFNSYFYSDNASYTVAILHSASGSGVDYLDNNSIITNGNSSSGLLLTNECSLNFFNNNITGFAYGMNMLGCTGSNLWKNTISANRDGSKGINAAVSSIINLTNLGELQGGGLNKISNYGAGCVNVMVDNSSFTSDYGFNGFSVTNSAGNNNYDGYGNFPGTNGFNSRYNCFNGVNGSLLHDLRDLKGHLYPINESPHDCSNFNNEDVLFTIPIAEGVTDTIYRSPDTLGANLPENMIIYKNLVINSIKREYDSVCIKGHYYLNTYTDSIYSPDIIAKLYHASVSLDSIGEVVQPLKTYYEQLIINNPNNTRLVTSAYYYIQKCKVYLEQYQSALAGFEDIIAQNPYGYEGLLASWDYAATLLLMDTIGAGGMSSKTELSEFLNESSTADFLVDTLRSKRLTKYDTYDKSVFTSNDRKTIIQNTATIFSDNRNKQVEKVKELEKKVNNKGEDATKSKSELATMKALNEVVKTKIAKNQPDYLRIITEDVNKVFKNPNEESNNNKVHSIPKTFELYQNYPNPFNPSTKIAFDLPIDSKVKLVIYDILGRQIKTLVDNELRTAGKYTIEYNGSNLASGVYFYRLQVEGSNKFTAVKKMVLIK